jgi:hypothetical protein
MARTFAEKFEEALAERRQAEPEWGLRTLARQLADGDPEKTKTILRRLQKYRPKPGRGGAGEVAPTEPTRREIERALGLPLDALKPEPLEAAAAMIAVLMPQAAFDSAFDNALARRLARATQSNGQVAHLRGERDLAATTTEVTHDGDPDD